MPYGRNSNRADFNLVLKENRGMCATKHALLAALAAEHNQPVFLTLGIYEMNEGNTPDDEINIRADSVKHRFIIHSPEELKGLYGEPNERSVLKVKDFLDDNSRKIIKSAPFAVLAANETDLSIARKQESTIRSGQRGILCASAQIWRTKDFRRTACRRRGSRAQTSRDFDE
ncbi:MAG: hypothetical protein ABI686_00790 [Acidobacteriota bacterium]